MEFQKFQKIKRFGTNEVKGINKGKCYCFPKIDGTNGSVWINNNKIEAGSRNRKLTLEKDNQGFYDYILKQNNIKEFLLNNPEKRLYGEWLVPHSLKKYRDDAWNKFYVFDVAIDKTSDEITHEGDDKIKYIHYEDYKSLLEKYNIEYIPPIAIIENGTKEKFINQLKKNTYLIKDGMGIGEGIVIKNYDFYNKYNRQVWAKIVTNEHKEKHSKEMGPPEIQSQTTIEEKIVNNYLTEHKIEKVYAKIKSQKGWESKFIPELLGRVWHDLITEEIWDIIKDYKNPIIDFNSLHYECISKIKKVKSELF